MYGRLNLNTLFDTRFKYKEYVFERSAKFQVNWWPRNKYNCGVWITNVRVWSKRSVLRVVGVIGLARARVIDHVLCVDVCIV